MQSDKKEGKQPPREKAHSSPTEAAYDAGGELRRKDGKNKIKRNLKGIERGSDASIGKLFHARKNPTKMGSEQMQKTDWREAAESLFFVEKKSIVEIAAEIGISRRSLSAYLHSRPGYAAERQRRKTENAEKRKAYQQEWDRTHRPGGRYDAITGETMRREHELAAMILSREKYG